MTRKCVGRRERDTKERPESSGPMALTEKEEKLVMQLQGGALGERV